jgi:hypothetical protein
MSNWESIVRHVMSHTLSQEVALEYNWVGKGSKKTFEKLRLKKVILGLYFYFFKGDFTGARKLFYTVGVRCDSCVVNDHHNSICILTELCPFLT